MLRLNKGHKYILCITDEVANYLIMVPIHQSRLEEMGNALIDNVISKYCVPNYINNASRQCIYVLTHELLVSETRYQNKKVAPYNHQSLEAEHGIKSLSTILTKHLSNLGQM